jgi:hypothetical protein
MFDRIMYEIDNSGMLATCFHAAIWLSLFFDPEDGGDMIL